MLTLSAEDYQVFVLVVSRKNEDHAPMPDPNIRCVVLPTPSSTIHFLLTEKELQQLHNMLQEVDNEMRTRQLIGLFR